MSRITYYPTQFDPNLVARMPRRGGKFSLECSMADLVRSAITVGRASWRKVIKFGSYSAFEMIYRSSLLYANLDDKSSAKFKQSRAYRNLDPSEKGAISYFIALTCAKLFAEQLFDVPWLMHLDVYRKNLTVDLDPGARPDLIGRDRSGCWVVIEAKGRTNNIDGAVKQKAKEQVRHLNQINGVSPILRVGVVSYFTSYQDLALYLEDPDHEPTEQTSIIVEENQFLFDYYRMFVDFMRLRDRDAEEHREDGRVFVAKYIEEMDLWVGLERGIYEILERTNPEHPRVMALVDLLARSSEIDRPMSVPSGNLASSSIGQDGVFVGLGQLWSKKLTE